MKANCKCIDTIDEMLAKHNTKLDVVLFITGDCVASIATIKKDKKKSGKPKTMLPSFCPFCGVKYDTGNCRPLDGETK